MGNWNEKAIIAGLLIALPLAILAPYPLAAEELLPTCKIGQYVLYGGGNRGEIIDEHGGVCLVISLNGRLQSWVAIGELMPIAAPPTESEPAAPVESSTERSEASEAAEASSGPDLGAIEFGEWPVAVIHPRKHKKQRGLPTRAKIGEAGRLLPGPHQGDHPRLQPWGSRPPAFVGLHPAYTSRALPVPSSR
jgi:hypothetical protein